MGKHPFSDTYIILLFIPLHPFILCIKQWMLTSTNLSKLFKKKVFCVVDPTMIESYYIPIESPQKYLLLMVKPAILFTFVDPTAEPYANSRAKLQAA